MIDAGAENARAGLPARIVGKMNAVTELQTMRALYRASQAGVQIDLVERITSIPDATLPDSDGYYEVG